MRLLRVSLAALQFSVDQVLQGVVLEREIRVHLLQTTILLLEFFQTLSDRRATAPPYFDFHW